MVDHQFDLRLHHANYLVDVVDFILAGDILPIKEVGAPDIPKEIIPNEFFLEPIRLLFRVGWCEFIPGLAGLNFGKHSNYF
jgi:hypothetical protein